MKLVQFDFPYLGPFGAEMAEALNGLAQSIAGEPGLIWKIWIENAETGEAGGIYLFTDEQSARSYMAKHEARLREFGIADIRAKIFDVNESLSKLTKAEL